MTKTERLRLARSVKGHLASFVDYQTKDMGEFFAKQGQNADYAAMNQLLMAQSELTALITNLRMEHYGEKYSVRPERLNGGRPSTPKRYRPRTEENL
jgi:hypothetical protein